MLTIDTPFGCPQNRGRPYYQNVAGFQRKSNEPIQHRGQNDIDDSIYMPRMWEADCGRTGKCRAIDRVSALFYRSGRPEHFARNAARSGDFEFDRR